MPPKVARSSSKAVNFLMTKNIVVDSEGCNEFEVQGL